LRCSCVASFQSRSIRHRSLLSVTGALQLPGTQPHAARGGERYNPGGQGACEALGFRRWWFRVWGFPTPNAPTNRGLPPQFTHEQGSPTPIHPRTGVSSTNSPTNRGLPTPIHPRTGVSLHQFTHEQGSPYTNSPTNRGLPHQFTHEQSLTIHRLAKRKRANVCERERE